VKKLEKLVNNESINLSQDFQTIQDEYECSRSICRCCLVTASLLALLASFSFLRRTSFSLLAIYAVECLQAHTLNIGGQ